MEAFFFVLFGGMAVCTAAYVVAARNPINSALSLIVTFLSLSGIYVMLNAHFLAVVQVLVYAGAIMVLFLFVIMLLNLREEDLGEARLNFFKVLGSIIGLGLLAKLVHLFTTGPNPVPGPQTQLIQANISPEWGGLREVGTLLFTDYLLAFEVVSILLLAAMVGALLISKKRA